MFARYRQMNRDERMHRASDQLTDKVIVRLCKSRKIYGQEGGKILFESLVVSLLVMSAAEVWHVVHMHQHWGSQTFLSCHESTVMDGRWAVFNGEWSAVMTQWKSFLLYIRICCISIFLSLVPLFHPFFSCLHASVIIWKPNFLVVNVFISCIFWTN